MIRKRLWFLGVPALIAILTLATAGTAQAQYRGGVHFGGAHVVGYRGFAGYRGAFVHGGYHFAPYYGYRYRYPAYGYRFRYYPYAYGYYPYVYGSNPYYDFDPYGYGYYPDYGASSYDDSWDPRQAEVYSPGVSAAGLTAVSPLSGGTQQAGSAGQADTTAHITVTVPAGADVWVDGANTYSAGPVRQFQSSPLTPGQKYTYECRARWKNDDGREVTQTQQVSVTAGGYASVAFPVSSKVVGPASATDQR
jgi:uncharacterized protein (TIGR03000 family)